MQSYYNWAFLNKADYQKIVKSRSSQIKNKNSLDDNKAAQDVVESEYSSLRGEKYFIWYHVVMGIRSLSRKNTQFYMSVAWSSFGMIG